MIAFCLTRFIVLEAVEVVVDRMSIRAMAAGLVEVVDVGRRSSTSPSREVRTFKSASGRLASEHMVVRRRPVVIRGSMVRGLVRRHVVRREGPPGRMSTRRGVEDRQGRV